MFRTISVNIQSTRSSLLPRPTNLVGRIVGNFQSVKIVSCYSTSCSKNISESKSLFLRSDSAGYQSGIDKAELEILEFIPTLRELRPLSSLVLVHSYFSPNFAASVNFDSSSICLTLPTPTFHFTLSLIRTRFRANNTHTELLRSFSL